MTIKFFFFLLCVVIISSCTNDMHDNSLEKTTVSKNVFQLKELNTTQIQALDKLKTVVIIPGGILEEHGPHMPSFTDGYWNEKFSDTLAAVIATSMQWNIVMFPTIPLGNSGANDVGLKYSFPGTYTVRFETLRAVFMDLAMELGEQGFKNIVVIHGHGAPNHQRAIDQASDFFNETYKGKMINLMGLNPIIMNWFEATKSKEEQNEDGFSIHAGMSETSSMLYIVPHLVDSGYKHAVAFTGTDMQSLFKIAKDSSWAGYFGSEKIATAKYGEEAWNNNSKMFTQYVLDILNDKIKTDTIPRFGDYMKTSSVDVMLDSLSLKEEQRRKEIQTAWLQRKNLQ